MDEQMNDTQYSEENMSKRSAGSAFKAVIRWLLRLILVVLIGAAIGAILYFVFANFYRQAIEPLQNNAARLSAIETSQVMSRDQLTERLDQLGERLAALENERTLDMEALDGLQGDITALDKAVQEQDDLLAQIEALQDDLNDLEGVVSYEATQVMGLIATQQAQDAPLNVVRQELKQVKAMELLSRSRLYLMQNNYGSAKDDIENASTVLLALKDEVPDYQQATVEEWIARLELAADNLPDKPALASDDLEIAWRLLVEGLPQKSPEPTLAGTDAPYIVTATPLADSSLTATATPKN